VITREELVERIQSSDAAFIIDEDLAEDTYIKDKKPFSGNVGIGGIAINNNSRFYWLKMEDEQFEFTESEILIQNWFFHDILNKFGDTINDIF